MTSQDAFVVIGGGLAGATGAEALRTQGFDGSISLISNEVNRPYNRPPLSKGYLSGADDRESVFVHPKDWYQDNHVHLHLGNAAVRIDRIEHAIALADGSVQPYAKLLIATGSTPRQLKVPGSDLPGIHYLRSIEQSEHIKSAFADARSVVMIGAGWIGLETAAAARAAGLDVTVIEAAALPLIAILGEQVAQVFADLHRAHGVDLRCDVTVKSIVGANGKVSGVELGDGSVIAADMVVVGIGIVPEVSLAQQAGLETENGILVDEHLRSSDADIYAAGDVANAFNPRIGRHIRVEHWANALNMPAVAASGMLGQEAVYDRLPFFYSDQYDLGLEYRGHAGPDEADQVVIRGDLPGRAFIAFWLRQDRVLAGMNVNIWDAGDDVRTLIESKRRVDVLQLANPDIALASI
ncbi:MAG: FAD-dependent oxidoreductase [Candidatus Nanopelagicales bacterium]